MDTSPETKDKIASQPALRPSIDLLALAIIAIQIIVAVYGFAVLPDTVPIHWGINGQANGYGPKWLGTFLFPLISIGVYMLVRVLLAAGPRLGGREATTANLRIAKLVIIGIMLLMLIIQLSTVAQ